MIIVSADNLMAGGAVVAEMGAVYLACFAKNICSSCNNNWCKYSQC